MSPTIYFCYFELIVIFILFRWVFSLRKKIRLLLYQLNGAKDNLGGSDLFDNLSKSPVLYKDLLIELHPDKYTSDPEKLKLSEKLCLELGKNKASYHGMIDILHNAINNGFQFSDKFKERHKEILH